MTTAISANSYGSLEGVAAMSTLYTDRGSFNGNTHPSDETVVTWINQISGFMNIALADNGFAVPITQVDAKQALDAVLNQYVADMVMASNSAGRFFTDKFLEKGLTPLVQIGKDINDWVVTNGGGIEGLGAVRRTIAGNLPFTQNVDRAGRDTFPIFQRDGFGNRFDDWSSQ